MSAGVISYRSWLYSTDETGKRVRAADRKTLGYTVMPVKPTPTHALSHPDDGSREQAMVQDGARLRTLARLTPLEEQVLELQERKHAITRQRHIAPAELEHHLDEGWDFVRRDEETNEVTVVREFMDVKHTYDEIAERLGLSVRQVERISVRARRKLRGVRGAR
jgi:hypothetical protein